MNIGIELILDNLGVTFEVLMLMLTFFGGLIFYAKDFRIGVIMHFLASALVFMLCYELSQSTSISLMVTMAYLVVLTFSLFFTMKSSKAGGLI